MVSIAELQQRVSDRRAQGARLLTTEETLAVLAIVEVAAGEHEIEGDVDEQCSMCRAFLALKGLA